MIVAGDSSDTQMNAFDHVYTVSSWEEGHVVRTVVAFVDPSDAALYAKRLGSGFGAGIAHVSRQRWAAVEDWCDRAGLRFQLEPSGTQLRPGSKHTSFVLESEAVSSANLGSLTKGGVTDVANGEAPVAGAPADVDASGCVSNADVEVPDVYTDLSFSEIRQRLGNLLRSSEAPDV